jgi:uncharacterized protein YciI
MKVLMFYDLAPGGLGRVSANLSAHQARLHEFHARGTLLMAGPLGNPPEGALGVFTSRDEAEAFIQADPFVLNGVVGSWRLVDWHEVLT